jgi:EAL domain-containing protein (putative c-di-GMP-specific phosphodiesterase class I)
VLVQVVSLIRIRAGYFDSFKMGLKLPDIAAIIAMGRNLKHIVIAEGIETQEQIAYLQSQHCEEGQGYLLSPPVGAAQFGHLLETGITAMVVN